MAYRQASPDSYGNIDAFGHGVASLIPMSGDMAYRPNQHQLSQSSLSTPGSSMAYGTSTQDRLMNDLNGHAFLPLGDNEIGEWRQYVSFHPLTPSLATRRAQIVHRSLLKAMRSQLSGVTDKTICLIPSSTLFITYVCSRRFITVML